MNNKCKICNRDNFSEFIHFNSYPRTISFLFSNKEESLKDKSPLTFLKCDYCQHIQISNDMPQSFYDDYIMTVSHSKKMNYFQNQQADQFIEMFNLKGKTIFEAGCGDGNFMDLLKNKGCLVFGNEPSKSFRELAIKKELNVDPYFINEAYININAPFDAVISREVMEHVPEPVEFLFNLKKLLKQDGFILIEVPNFEKSLKEQRFYDMFPDHLSYFTRESLTVAMLISGFKNINIHYGMDEEFIYATGQNRNINSNGLKAAFNLIHIDFNKLCKEFNNIVVWGAGGKGISALGSLQNISKIKYVVDSDPFKHNKYLPSSGLIVKNPEVLFNDSTVDLLIITNLAYTDEIINILKINNFQSKIMLLSKNGITEFN